MNCKFYLKNSKGVGMCTNSDCVLDHCYFSDCFNECECFELKEMKKETPDNLPLPEDAIPLKGCTIALPKYSARISIGNFQINLTDKTFTEEQIKNMKEMLGWEVENL